MQKRESRWYDQAEHNKQRRRTDEHPYRTAIVSPSLSAASQHHRITSRIPSSTGHRKMLGTLSYRHKLSRQVHLMNHAHHEPYALHPKPATRNPKPFCSALRHRDRCGGRSRSQSNCRQQRHIDLWLGHWCKDWVGGQLEDQAAGVGSRIFILSYLVRDEEGNAGVGFKVGVC